MPSGMTVDEFLPWAEGRPGRHELDRGTVFTMASQRVGHLLAKAGAVDALAVARARLPSLCHCLAVDADRRVVIHHARDRDGIATRRLGEGSLRLDPPGLDAAVDDLFSGPPDG